VMQLSTQIPLHGTLSITKTTGELLVQRNVIVQLGRYNVLAGLASSLQTSPLASLAIGTGGTSDQGGIFPIPATSSQQQLNTPLAVLPIIISGLSQNSSFITVTADVPQSEYNGNAISEAALFNSVGQMFNYVTFPSIDKLASFGLAFSWNIGF